MEYNGAEDWWYWGGVYYGYNGEGLISVEFVAPTFVFDNPVSEACLEAFYWGFYLGLELTEDEYIDLTGTKKSIILEVIDENEELLDFLNDSKIEGNC